MKLSNYKLIDLIQPMGALLFVPILFTLLFGWIYSEIYVENVPFAIYDCDNSETSREIVSKFQSSPDLELTGYANSSQELQQMVLEGQIVVGVYLPDNLGQEIREQKSPKILIYVDNTNTVIGNNAYSYAAKVANMVSAGIELNYLEGAGITSAQAEETIGVLSLAERTLYNPQLGYYRYLFAALLAILVQQTYINVATSKLITLRNQLLPKGQIWLKAAKYILYCMSLSTISSLSCILLANYCFDYPIRSSLTPVVGILLIFLLNMTAVCLILATCFTRKIACVQFVMLLSVPTILTCGYVWPEFMMPDYFASFIKSVWPLYYIAAPLTDLLVKGTSWLEIKPYIYGGLIFALIWLPVSTLLYSWRRQRSLQAASPPKPYCMPEKAAKN